MKLTETHIKELYTFTRQHYVYFYDVQTELVDHLANDIENIWIEKPNLSFEQARDISFKKFGIFGFMDVVESRQNAMNKSYFKTILSVSLKNGFVCLKLFSQLVYRYCLFFLYKNYFFKCLLYSMFQFIVTSIYNFRSNSLNNKHKRNLANSSKYR